MINSNGGRPASAQHTDNERLLWRIRQIYFDGLGVLAAPHLMAVDGLEGWRGKKSVDREPSRAFCRHMLRTC